MVSPLNDNGVKKRWWQSWKIYTRPEVLKMLFLGFSAGLPLVLVMGTLSRRLAEAGIDRSWIGYLSWVGLVYAFKWIWAPFVDQVRIPLLTRYMGRRRSWLLVSQALIISGLCGMGLADVQQGLTSLVICSIWVAFASATQDIALDAFRIESAEKQMQSALAATYQTGYRLAMIWAGAGALWVAAFVQGDDSSVQQYTWMTSSAMPGGFWNSVRLHTLGTFYDQHAWSIAYLVMAVSMGVGVLTVLLSSEPKASLQAQEERFAKVQRNRHLPWHVRLVIWIKEVVIAPFSDFFVRYRWYALTILALIAVYRISDVVMGVMSGPFYAEMGYTKVEVAAASKIYGVVMTLLGTFLGGMLVMRSGIYKILMLGAVLSAATNLLFAGLVFWGHDFYALIVVISMDNLSSGIASAAFIGYLSSLTNVSFSATQYAIFSSIMVLLPKFVSGFSGDFVNVFGYANFFVATALLGVPVIFLVHLASRANEYTPMVAHGAKLSE